MKLKAGARLRAAQADDNLEVTVTLRGDRERVERVLALLHMVEYNGNVGHSGTFGIAWDGDGQDKIEIQGLEAYADRFTQLAGALSSYGGDAEIVGEGGQGFILRTAYDEPKDYHYTQFKKVFPTNEDKE